MNNLNNKEARDYAEHADTAGFYTVTLAQKITLLLSYGYEIGLRIPEIKAGVPGHFMVAEDACGGPDEPDRWAVVGDNIEELIDQAFAAASVLGHFDTALADIKAGGIGLLHADGTGAGQILR